MKKCLPGPEPVPDRRKFSRGADFIEAVGHETVFGQFGPGEGDAAAVVQMEKMPGIIEEDPAPVEVTANRVVRRHEGERLDGRVRRPFQHRVGRQIGQGFPISACHP